MAVEESVWLNSRGKITKVYLSDGKEIKPTKIHRAINEDLEVIAASKTPNTVLASAKKGLGPSKGSFVYWYYGENNQGMIFFSSDLPRDARANLPPGLKLTKMMVVRFVPGKRYHELYLLHDNGTIGAKVDAHHKRWW